MTDLDYIIASNSRVSEVMNHFILSHFIVLPILMIIYNKFDHVFSLANSIYVALSYHEVTCYKETFVIIREFVKVILKTVALFY